MKKSLIIPLLAFILGFCAFWLGKTGADKTSTNEYCASCHVHPQATNSWKQSVHHNTSSGMRIGCVECHLPPKGEGYLKEKIKTGSRDLWSKWTKDTEKIDWEAKSNLQHAVKHVYNRSCEKCHETIFPLSLSKEGEEAHLYYSQNVKEKDLQCINCHLNAGHHIPGYKHGGNETFGKGSTKNTKIFDVPAKVNSLFAFTEQIPGSSISFDMKAIPGGSFKMGSPEKEAYRQENEGPVKEVQLSPFFMAEIEVSWDEYLEFYRQTSSHGRSTDVKTGDDPELDAISGATPPYGQPDQGWGLGQRPAITIRYHAAQTYCKWLSNVTGKTYRLPTEAEWEYACRAESNTPYFFEGDPKKFQREGFLSKFQGNDTCIINTYVIYKENSGSKTALPDMVAANAYGLKNMLGNVAEYCSDWYADDVYGTLKDGIKNPKGPSSGTEHVIRGGSFMDQAGDLRCAVRKATESTAWMKTDPQSPKSVWWFSDCMHVGFRVVCEFDEKTGNK